MKMKSGRTLAYRFTVDSKDDVYLGQLKAQIVSHNKTVRKDARKYGKMYSSLSLMKVVLMGRGPRRDAKGKRFHFNSDCCLQHQYATHWDVYVLEDGSGNYNLREELSTGITPGDMAKIAALNKQIWSLELAGHKRNADLGRKIHNVRT